MCRGRWEVVVGEGPRIIDSSDDILRSFLHQGHVYSLREALIMILIMRLGIIGPVARLLSLQGDGVVFEGFIDQGRRQRAIIGPTRATGMVGK
jgi:hypothetical protein